MQIRKKFIQIIILFLIVFFIPSNVLAFSAYSADTLKFDKTLSENTDSTNAKPAKIYVTQISTNSEELQRDSSKWVKSLYYYAITRLHFSQLPYTYLLDENGIIYQGNESGPGTNPQLDNLEGGVTIGYLSNNSVLTNRASESLSEVVEKISFDWGISQLSVVKFYINKSEGTLSTVTPEEITGEFADSVKESLVEWKGYQEENLAYKAKIVEVIYDQEIAIGSRLKVKVRVQNANDFIWFTSPDPLYVSTSTGAESSFAVNQGWESFSRPKSISERNILPGETVDFEFEMEGRVLLGEASESFVILKFAEKPFEGSEFDVKFVINRGEKQLVEVASPKYSFVKIRDCRWYSCKELGDADNGTIFILESEEEGWSKIQFGVDLYGWVNSAYLKKI